MVHISKVLTPVATFPITISPSFIMEMKGNECGRLVYWCREVHMSMLCLADGFKGQITVECWHVQKALSPQLLMKHGTGNYLIWDQAPTIISSFMKQPQAAHNLYRVLGTSGWTGHAGCAWVDLEKWCLLEWALRRGISPLPLKQWAVGSGSAAGASSTPLSQIRQAEMSPEAAHNIC